MDVSANRFGLYEPRESIRLALGNFTGVRALMSWWIFMILIGSFPIVANFDDSTRKRRWKEKILTYDLISSRRSIWVSWGLYGSSVCGILSAQHFFDYHRRGEVWTHLNLPLVWRWHLSVAGQRLRRRRRNSWNLWSTGPEYLWSVRAVLAGMRMWSLEVVFLRRQNVPAGRRIKKWALGTLLGNIRIWWSKSYCY